MKFKLLVLIFGVVLLSGQVLAFDTYINNSNIFVDGKVGIGTESPTQKLDVNGSINVTGNLLLGEGMIAYNSSAGKYVYYNGSVWGDLGSGEVEFTGSVVRATSNSGQTILGNSTWMTIVFENQEWDTNNEYDEASGRFTAKRAGYYKVDSKGLLSAVTWAEGDGFVVALSRNGVNVAYGTVQYFATTTDTYKTSILSTVVYLDVGDYIEIQAFQNSNTDKDLIANNEHNYLSIYSIDKPYSSYSNGTVQWTSWAGGDLTYTNGSVGIGTSSPEATLDIANNNSLELVLRELHDGGAAQLRFNNTVREWHVYADSEPDVFGIYDWTEGVDRFLINGTNGNVGIGTSSPSAMLDVNGSVNLNNASLFVDSDGHVGIGTDSPSVALEIHTDSSEDPRIRMYDIKNGNTASSLSFFKSRLGSTTLNGDPLGRLYFYGNKEGADRMGAEIEVEQTDAIGDDYYPHAEMQFKTSDGSAVTQRMVIDSIGNVGIGASSPEARLEVETSSGGVASFGDSTTSATGNWGFAVGRYSNASGFYTTAIGYNASASNNVAIALGFGAKASGHYSIALGRGIESSGRNSVAIALDNMEGINVSQDNTMSIMGGDVGIGTTSPSSELVVYNENGATRIMIDNPGTAPNHQSTLVLSTKGEGGNYIGVDENTTGWEISGRGDAYTNADERNDLHFGYWNGTTWSNPMQIDASTGNVGIGTASPGVKLDVGGMTRITGSGDPDYPSSGEGFEIGWDSDGTTVMNADSSDAVAIFQSYDRDASAWRNLLFGGKNIEFDTNGTTAMVINSDGNVGIGTSSPSAALEIAGNATSDFRNAAIVIDDTSASGRTFSISSRPVHDFVIADETASQIRFVIDTNGYVGLSGAYTPSYRFQVGDGSSYGYVDGSGNWQSSSDIRFKENVIEIEDALDLVNNITGIRYNVVNDTQAQIGFSAQDLQAVLPEVVSVDKDGYYGVAYAKLTPVLIEAIKELNNKTDSNYEELKSENEMLKSELCARDNSYSWC